MKNKDLDYYVGLNWSFTVEQESTDGTSYYVIYVNELPGVATDAESIEEGMVDIKEAIRATIELYLKQGDPIPEPVDKRTFKGNISYRTSPQRHYAIARLARQKHQSLSRALDTLVDVGIEQLLPDNRTRHSA